MRAVPRPNQCRPPAFCLSLLSPKAVAHILLLAVFAAICLPTAWNFRANTNTPAPKTPKINPPTHPHFQNALGKESHFAQGWFPRAAGSGCQRDIGATAEPPHTAPVPPPGSGPSPPQGPPPDLTGLCSPAALRYGARISHALE